MNEIVDRLYIGDWNDALSLTHSNPNSIAAVLNVCENINVGLAMSSYLHIPFPDHFPIPADKFSICMSWLNAQYNSCRRRVFVHCACGVSRSPTICAAFLTKVGLASNIDEALTIIKNARPQADPDFLVFASARSYVGN